MLRTRIFKDIQLNELYNDKYEEFGDLINGEYEIKKTEKSDSSVLLDLSFNGLVRDPQSKEKISLAFEKIIELRNNEIKIIIKGAFRTIPNKETVLKRILEDLYLGIDFPFYFNGNPDNFSWESYQVLFKEDTKNSLIDTFEYPGIHFKAIDGDYNLSIEFQIGNESKKELDAVKFFKFPLIAYTFTDEGYKQIYQGVNMLSRFKLKKNFEYKINLKIS
jgi:hypothetical protein